MGMTNEKMAQALRKAGWGLKTPKQMERKKSRDREWMRVKRITDGQWRDRKNAEYREKYHSDPEFLAREKKRKKEWYLKTHA
jgi:hypothetical protein